ncbi:DUF6877 family protein [Lysinibacillus sp. UGB7]|uniref:DUF6877 family protein n=1 Tax=Lysinibacillus sp. UGB7 TaxID=3411039 RepID=UPI003B7EC62A
MKTFILPINEVRTVAHILPKEAIEDIEKRMSDWMLSGGNDDDPYMYQQSHYAKELASYCEMKTLK